MTFIKEVVCAFAAVFGILGLLLMLFGAWMLSVAERIIERLS